MQSSFLVGRYWRPMLLLVSGLLISTQVMAADDGHALWTDAGLRPLSTAAPQASKFRPLSLDVAGMQARLAETRNGGTVRLALPKPGGGFATFELVDSGTMPPALQLRYPEIISLAGHDADGNRVRVDSSSRGFQAMVFGKEGVWVVRPEQLGRGSPYISVYKADLPAPERQQLGPDVIEGLPGTKQSMSRATDSVPLTATGATNRVYRLAVAANHQYVAAVGGGTKAGGQAAVVQAINRVNQVYETELGVHLTLIDNNDTLIFADAGTDPYGNDADASDQNQVQLDNRIGSTNYDVGHVFTTGSGGVAGLGVTCLDGQKAIGTTGLPNPVDDAFYIDYVAHELGHQFGANHPFNAETGSCGGGNRSVSTAYEPGSGSTILAYAGICGENDLQPHSNPYFHAISLHEIETWIEGDGGACAVASARVDAAPVIDANSLPAAGLTIPMHTPFRLAATATDADGDTLSYTWEQFDLGDPANLTQGDIGNGPIFRSRPPTANGAQTFPALSTVLSGTLDKGDTWAVTNRSLNFRLTVRDNHDVPAAPQYGRSVSTDAATLTVTTQAGPFVVTQPNTALSWAPGSTQVVTWNVAGTDQAPVQCSNVSLRLSTDGGASFPTVLAANVANDGSENITVPTSLATQGRVEIACDNNVFFDVSDVDFTIANLADLIFANGFDPNSITQPLLDPSFEATTAESGANPNWQGSDTHAGAGATPFLSSASGITTRTGTWAVWFGGWGTAAGYAQSASQSVTLAQVSPLYLHYWRRVAAPTAGAGDVMTVRVDGNVVASVDASTLTAEPQYGLQSVDISAYADGSAHTLTLHFEHASTGDDADIFVDDVTISMSPIAARR